MPQTGIPTHNDAIHASRDFSLGKTDFKFIVFAIQDNVIQVESTGTTHEEFVNAMPDNQCRYAMYKLMHTMPSEIDGFNDVVRSKDVMIMWTPSGSGVKDKFVYSATRIPFKERIGFSGLGIQAGNKIELEEAEMLAKCKSAFKQ